MKIKILFLLLALSNCASFQFNPNLVYIETEETDSYIFINGEMIGRNSAVYPVSPNSQKKIVIEVKNKNFEPEILELKREIDWYTFGNLLYLGFSVVGFLIDYYTDSLFVFQPGPHKVVHSRRIGNSDTNSINFDDPMFQTYSDKLVHNSDKKSKVYSYYFTSLSLPVYTEKETPDDISVPSGYSSEDTPQGVQFSPGMYSVKGKIGTVRYKKQRRSRYISQYFETEKQFDPVVFIPAGGETVICGFYDRKLDKAKITTYHFSEDISNKYRNNFWMQRKPGHYFGNVCETPYGLRNRSD